jgi:hypothetical protein
LIKKAVAILRQTFGIRFIVGNPTTATSSTLSFKTATMSFGVLAHKHLFDILTVAAWWNF